MDTIRVGCLSYAPFTTTNEIVSEIRRAKASNPDLRILTMCEGALDVATASTFETVAEIYAPLAIETQLYLGVTFIEECREKTKYFSSIIMLNPQGQIVAHHRAKSKKPFAPPSTDKQANRYNDRKYPKWLSVEKKAETYSIKFIYFHARSLIILIFSQL
jgi:hypothetical protein